MERRQFVIATGTAAAGVLAGCTSRADEDDPAGGETADGGAAASLDGQRASGRTITVDGTGETEAEPDLATISVSVTATGDDQQRIRDDLATRGDQVETALREFGIPEDAITTDRFEIHAARQRPPDHPDASEDAPAYEGVHSLTVEVDDVDDTGAAIDAAIDAGADEVGRITFSLSEERRDQLREEALRSAIANAREEAEVIAGEIDATVVQADSVDASGGGVSPVRTSYDAAEGDDAASAMETAIREDDVTVSASVSVTYEIE